MARPRLELGTPRFSGTPERRRLCRKSLHIGRWLVRRCRPNPCGYRRFQAGSGPRRGVDVLNPALPDPTGSVVPFVSKLFLEVAALAWIRIAPLMLQKPQRECPSRCSAGRSIRGRSGSRRRRSSRDSYAMQEDASESDLDRRRDLSGPREYSELPHPAHPPQTRP
jgi:hypothetical protein